MGLAKGVEQCIRLADTQPFRERSRRIAPADIDDVNRHLKDLLEAGIIKESRSLYASPFIIVRKKNGKIRMCIDYRNLNRMTIPNDDTQCLNQIPMSEPDMGKTAFICPLGFYQFERLPQGVTVGNCD